MRELFGILLGLVIVAGILTFLGWGVQHSSVESFDLSGARIGEALVLEGVLTIDNPSRLPVPVQGVPYTVTSSTGTIATGQVDGFMLLPGSSKTEITIEIDEQTLTGSVGALLDQRVSVNGTVQLPLGISLPFEDSREIGSGGQGSTLPDTQANGLDLI